MERIPSRAIGRIATIPVVVKNRFYTLTFIGAFYCQRRRVASNWSADLLRCMSPFVCRFLDAGMTNSSTRCGGRRPKSAKARSRGKFGLMLRRALWGFDSGAALEGGCNTDRMRPVDQATGEIGSV
jgi:hypothetical protein